MTTLASQALNGVVLVDKPTGITSNGVVSKVRKAAGTRKVGHAGTLDPDASGLLVLGINQSTRLLTYLVGLDKEYRAIIRLGQSSSTDDAEGELSSVADVSSVTKAAIDAGIAVLTGPIMQRPSSVSAIKVNGVRSYARVRAGEDVELAQRPVTVHSFTVEADEQDSTEDGGAVRDLTVHVHCSSGTYIRALARDLGASLGVGGHLISLRRTRVGPFDVADAVTLDHLAEHSLEQADLAGPAQVAGTLMPVVVVDSEQALALSQGKRVPLDLGPQDSDPRPLWRTTAADGLRAAVDPGGVLIGLIAEDRPGVAKSAINFPPS